MVSQINAFLPNKYSAQPKKTSLTAYPQMKFRSYSVQDRDQAISLWQRVLPDDQPHNEASRVIDAKLAVDAMLFIAEDNGTIIASAMAGYDGHRGWLYSVAVDPQHRRKGIGRELVETVVQEVKCIGCIKVNLQVRSTNSQVVEFYESLGFTVEERISMGKLLGQ
tara:strand:+ start:59 stop:553 length:495 start_codon:yes stop_codon:yes gene_type:complete